MNEIASQLTQLSRKLFAVLFTDTGCVAGLWSESMTRRTPTVHLLLLIDVANERVMYTYVLPHPSVQQMRQFAP